MNEFTKARLQLLIAVVLFFVFVSCLIFGIVKVRSKFTEQKEVAKKERIIPSEPEIIEKKNPENTVAETKTLKKEKLEFDKSNTFYGIHKKWRRFRLPKCGILLDVSNNKLLWSYNADRVVPIASLSKMLTVYMALDAIRRSDGKVRLSNRVKISKNSATGREGAFGFMPGDIYTVEDLMQAATIRSSNDAAASLAVYFGNGEAEFVKMMNLECRKLGMNNSKFINAHGLPVKNKDNLSTMNDMLAVALRLLNEPDYMRWSKKKAAKIGKKTIVNTNNLMRKRKYPGVDGLKTGYTRRAGFCLAFSCLRGGRRLLGVVAGFPSAADRENFVTALLDWAYGQG